MPVSAIDTLMQIATPPRAVEPPAPSPSGSAFGPALEKAYTAEKPRDPAPPDKADDKLQSAANSAADSDGADDERAEEAAAATDTAPAEEGEPSGEESSDDDVEISDLASTVVAAGEAQTAAAAQQADAAIEALEGEADKTGGDDATADGDAAAETRAGGEAAAEGEAGAAVGKSWPYNYFSTAAGENADGDAKSVRQESGKSKKAGETGVVDATEKNNAAAGDAAIEDGQQVVSELEPKKPELTELEAGGETGSDTGESKSSHGEAVARLKLPPAEQTAELAAAIERHVAMMEQSASVAEAPSQDVAALEGATAAPSTQRSAATLERLAAASMRRGESPSSAEGGPAIDRPRFLQRVEGALRAAQQRDGRVQVRLAPPELGSLRIELSVQNGAMTAKLEAETPAARNALLDNLPALRDRLAEQNIRVEKFDVDIRRDSSGSGENGNLPDQTGDRHDQGSQRRQNHAAQPQVKTSSPRTARPATAAADAGLDVRI